MEGNGKIILWQHTEEVGQKWIYKKNGSSRNCIQISQKLAIDFCKTKTSVLDGL